MAATSPNPEDRLPWPELGDILRPAVEQARREPPPADAVHRALARARRVGRTRPRRWLGRPTHLLVTGAVAATLLIGLGLHYGSNPRGGYKANVPERGDDRPPLWPGDAGPAVLPAGRPPVVLLGNTRFLGMGEHGDGLLPIGLVHQGSNWADWERVQALRDLVDGMPRVDRVSIESYLRTRSPGTQPVVWRRHAPRLAQAQVRDADGQGLKLVGLTVQVRIEGARARTLLDHIFSNTNPEALRGILECPLPDGASPSFFALFPGHAAAPSPRGYLRPGRRPPLPAECLPPATAIKTICTDCWGSPRQAVVVPCRPLHPEPDLPGAPPEKAAGPAANTLRTPVGTVPPRGMIRVVVAYEELLPIIDGRLVYRHALPAEKLYELKVTVQADRALARDARFEPADAVKEDSEDAVTYRRSWGTVTGAGEVVFDAPLREPGIQATSGIGEDTRRYLFARLRPDVPDEVTPPFARQAVFLLDTSAAEDPRRFDLCVRLMRRVLRADPDIERFNVLTFSTGSAWLEPTGWLANTRAGRDQALRRLDGIVLEGGSDLGAALDRLRAAPFLARGTPLDVFLLSDGRLSWGETDLARLTARFEGGGPGPLRWHCYHTGLGEENAELFAALTRRGGGVYRCGGDKDLAAAARAHRRSCLLVRRVRFVGGPEARDILVAGRREAIYPGGELLVAARFDRAGRSKIELEGEVAGKRVVRQFAVEVGEDGQLAPRAWGELAVASLLALNDPTLEPLAHAYAATFGITSRRSAFALTQDKPAAPPPPEQEYTRLVKGELGGFLEAAWAGLSEPLTPARLRQRLQAQIADWSPAEPVRRELRHLAGLVDETLPPVPAATAAPPLTRALADAAYLAARQKDKKRIGLYLDEATRRARGGDAAGAVRVLGGLVEEHPGQAEVVRLVAGRLLAMDRPALAVELLARLVEAQPADPANHRALAMALDDADRPGLAALHYEAALKQLDGTGDWVGAVRTEYHLLLRRAHRDPRLPGPLRQFFADRLKRMAGAKQADLQVWATWNGGASQVALEVTSPDGRRTVISRPGPIAGTSQGPRRFELPSAAPGEYAVEVRLSQATPQSPPETCVRVTVIRHGGTSREEVRRFTVLLRQHGDHLRVCQVKH